MGEGEMPHDVTRILPVAQLLIVVIEVLYLILVGLRLFDFLVLDPIIYFISTDKSVM